MKRSLGTPRPADVVPTTPRLLQRIDRLIGGDVIVIDTDATRYTFIVHEPMSGVGTLGGGRFYDPVAAVLVGSVSSRSTDYAPGLSVGWHAVFALTRGDRDEAHRVEVRSLRRLSRTS